MNKLDEKFSNTDEPVMLMFWAPWCGPCRLQVETNKKLSPSLIKYVALDIDEDKEETAKKFKIVSIPTILLLKGGQEVGRIVGITSCEKIEEKIREVIG